MVSTKSTKKEHLSGLGFLALIAVFFFVYFVAYMTPSRKAWYREMRNQVINYYQEIIHIGS